MRHKKLRFLLFLLLIITGTYLSAQENYEIRRVIFKGNKTLDKGYLLDKMALKEVRWIEKVLTKNEPVLYSQELIDMDLERLVRIYQSEGFLQAKASLLPPKINDNNQTIWVRINVEEGKPMLVDSVSFHFAGQMGNVDTDSLQKRVLRKLRLKKKKRFRDESLDTDVQYIEDACSNLGYAYVDVSYKTEIDFNNFTTGIRYTITPGPKAFFGETNISGNKHVTETFIRKQLSYKEGEVYDKSELTETRQDLYRLQLFRVASVLPQKKEKTKESPIPVNIYIEEAPRLDTRFGAGYGTEDKFRAFVDLNYLGFLGGARRINLYAKHSALEPYFVQLRWIQPQFLGLDASVSLNPFIRAQSEPGYKIRSYGIETPFTYHFNPRLRSKVTYNFEHVEQQVESGDEELPDFEDDKFPYTKSGILLGTVFNDSRPVFSPEKGINASIGFRMNGHFLGGSFNYTRLWADFRIYHKIGEVVLSYRIMAGGIASADTSGFIPVEDRFYSGGSNSNRGWSRQQLGPKRASGTPIGGKSIFETNLEARYHLFWRLSIAAFIDASNVWLNSYEYHLGELAYAVGPGLRISTPIGPIRFDVGFPVWNQKHGPQFFLSVGEAF